MENSLIRTKGLLGEATEADTTLKAWGLFMAHHIIDEIVWNNNVKI